MWDEDKFFFNRHDSVSDSVSSSAASAGFIPLFLTRNM